MGNNSSQKIASSALKFKRKLSATAAQKEWENVSKTDSLSPLVYASSEMKYFRCLAKEKLRL